MRALPLILSTAAALALAGPLLAFLRENGHLRANYRGAMLGWEMSPDQLASARPAVEGPVRNLYFTGHWTRPGGGITPVIVSAMDAARAITGVAG